MLVDGLILAGGKSTRMGGKHKGNLLSGSETFTERMIKEMRGVTERIWLSYGNEVHKIYPGCQIVQDMYQDCGPIGGIHAGLKACKSNAILVAACDMPYLKKELYEFLYEYLFEDTLGVVPVVEGKVHPLAAIYKKEMLFLTEQQILEKNYRIRDLLVKAGVKCVDVTEYPEICQMLQNINTEKQYQEFKKEEGN